MTFAVFISFARPSGEGPARTLRAALLKLGLRAFVDESDIEPGALWDQAIKTAQEQAQVSLVVLSADTPGSDHQNSEVQAALILAGASSTAHRVVPWPVEGAPEPRRWPSGLSARQAIRGEAEEVARQLFLTLKGAPTTDVRPSAAALQEAAAWLAERFPSPAARRLAIQAAGLPLDPKLRWAAQLAELDLPSVEALIQATGDEEDGAEAILTQLRQSVGALPVWVPVDLRPEIDATLADLKAERFAGAEGRLRHLLAQVGGAPPALTHSLRARLIGALLLQGKADEALGLIDQVDPAALAPAERERFARHLLVWERWVEGEAAAPDSVVIGQLIALLRDHTLPERLAPDAEVQLRAAELHVRAGRLNEAVGCAEAAWGVPGLTTAGKQAVAHVVLAALAMHWVGEGALPLRAPGRLLTLLDRWEVEAGPWPALADLRGAVEQHPLGATQGAAPPAAPEGAAWAPPLFRDLARAEQQPGVEAIRAVVEQHPAAGLAKYALAYALLGEGELEAALEAAQQAHAALPGRGQRIRLAEALTALGRNAEASALIDGLQPRLSPWWRLFVAVAPSEAEGETRAKAWTEAEPKQPLAWATLAEAAYRIADLEEARRAAHRALELKQPFRLNSLKVFAHIALQKPADQPLSRALISCLEDSNEAEAEGLRMWLLLGDPDAPAKPVDWARLAQNGGVQQVDVEDVLSMILAKRAAAPTFDHAWSEGMLCHATWARMRGMPVGISGLGLRRGELRVPTPLPLIGRSATTHGSRCLIDQLGLEIIAAERLLDEVGAQIGALVTFDDVVVAAENAPVQANQPALKRELRDIDALWAPVAAAPRSPSGPTLHEADAPAVRRWLRDWGHTVHGAIGAIAWSPPPEGVVIGAAILLELGEDRAAFARECSHQQVILTIAEPDYRARTGREEELRGRLEAAELAEDLARWLRGLRRAGRLKIVARPPPMVARGETEADLQLGWVWSHRAALEADPDLVLVTAELAEWGHGCTPPEALLRGWGGHEERIALLARLQGLRTSAEARICTLPALLRAACPPERWRSVAGRMADAGYADAWGPEEIASMLGGPEALGPMALERRLRGWLPWLGGATWGSTETWLSFEVGLLTLGPALLQLWDQRDATPKSGDAGLAPFQLLLAQIDALDAVSRRRAGLLRHAVTGLLAAAVGRPGPAGDTTLVSLASTIGSWASATPAAREALHSALVSSAHCLRELEQESKVLTVLYSADPFQQGRIDLGGPAWAALAGRLDGLAVLERLSNQGRTLSQWVAAALEATPWEVDGLSVIAEVSRSPEAGAMSVRLPLALTLHKHGPAELNTVAALLRAQDAAVTAALRALAAEPSDAARHPLQATLARSPLPWVRLNPLSILSWTLFSQDQSPWPRTLDELRALLGEPALWIADAAERLRATFEAESSQAVYDLRPLVAQLSLLPGVSLGLSGRAERPMPEGLSPNELERYSTLIEDHRHHAVGEIASALFALSRSGAQGRVQRLGERDVALPRLAADLAAAALAPPPPKPAPGPLGDRLSEAKAEAPLSYADLEAPMLRALDGVVGQLGGSGPLPSAERTQLAWRLLGWWSAQAARSPDPVGALRGLAAAAPPTARSPSAELFDPLRFGPGGVDLREIVVLQAIYVVASNQRQDKMALDWERVKPALSRIAARGPSPAERALQRPELACAFGSPVLCGPDLALATILRLDPLGFEREGDEARMRWLDAALGDADAPAHLWLLRDQALLAFALRPALRTEAERRLLAERLGAAPSDRSARRRALLRFSGVCPSLAPAALTLLRGALTTAPTDAAAEALGDALYAHAGTPAVLDVLDAVLTEVHEAALPDEALIDAMLPLSLGRGRAEVPALCARLWPEGRPELVAALLGDLPPDERSDDG